MPKKPTDLGKETFDAVQAALLNSECSPQEAVDLALRAVAQFAVAEDVVPDRKSCYDGEYEWKERCDKAWKEYPEIP